TETNAALSTGGTLTATDVDSATTFVAQTNVAGSNGYGSFSINSAGAWTYTMNSAHNEFVGGQNYTDSITVATADGTTQLITVTIGGTNDAAVLSSATVNLTETNAVLSTNGTLTISDVDSAATFVAQTGTIGTCGTFTINAAGAWTYVASSAHNEFAAGTTYTDTFTVTSADGTTTSVTVNIAGTNDAAVITGTSAGSVTEDTALTSTGTLSINDPDAGQSAFQPQTSAITTYGTFTINAAGVWTYVLDNNDPAVQSLAN